MEPDWPATLPRLLARGRDWLAIDKPAGLAVHAGPRTVDCLEARLAAAGVRAVPVHRLDRDTSGCLLLATRPAAARRLRTAFAERRIAKTYWAIVASPEAGDSGRISAPLAKRSSRNRGWRMVIDPAGKPAVTAWQVLARAGDLALIAMFPETGRTHQLRVHATLLGRGSHIVGDPVYGRADAGGLMLHARALVLPTDIVLPTDTGETIRICAEVPPRFLRLGFGKICG